MAGTYNLSCKLKINKKNFTNYLGAVYLGMNTSYRLIYIRDLGMKRYYCFLACVNTNYKAPFLQCLLRDGLVISDVNKT